MTTRPRYRRKCTVCRIKVLDKHEILFNIDTCDDCITEALERADKQKLAKRMGVDPAQLDHTDLPDFDPELHT